MLAAACGIGALRRDDPSGSARERLALETMLDPETCRLAWPSRVEVLALEEALSWSTCALLAKGGVDEALAGLGGIGLRPDERRTLVRMGMQEVQRRHGSLDLAEARALTVARVEDYVRRCREGHDLDREIKGLKLLTVVLGLTRTEPENAARAFLDALDQAVRQGPPDAARSAEVEVIDVPRLESP
jgi:hypothetical protein